MLSGNKVLCYHHSILSEPSRWGWGRQWLTQGPRKTSRVVHLRAVLSKIDGQCGPRVAFWGVLGRLPGVCCGLRVSSVFIELPNVKCGK